MIDVYAIAAAYPIEGNACRYIDFFLRCLQAVKHQLPDDAQISLEIANQFWSGQVPDEEHLRVERSKCTRHFATDSDFDAPYRLVSFALSPPVGMATDNLDWFAFYLEKIGIPADLLSQAIAECFPK